MANLTTLSKVKSFLGITNTTDDDLLQDIFIPTASNMVEGYCKRVFGTLNGTLVMDYAHPYTFGDGIIYFRDSDVTDVYYAVVGDTTLTSGTYDLLPKNSTPKQALRILNSTYVTVPNRENAILIGGTLGYGSIPAAVETAATRLAAYLYREKDNEGSIVIADGVTNIPQSAPKIIFTLLDTGRYVKDQFFTGSP